MNKRSNAKGITLIALVITIIVLLIIAGVSINLVLGENGIFNRASKSAKITQIKEVEEIANLAYSEIKFDELVGGEKANLTNFFNNLEQKGYIIKDIGGEGTVISDIVLSQDSINIKPEETKDIEYEVIYGSEVKHFISIQNEYYEIKVENDKVLISEESTDLTKIGFAQNGPQIVAEPKDSNVVTATVSGNKITLQPGSKVGTTIVTIKETQTNLTKEIRVRIPVFKLVNTNESIVVGDTKQLQVMVDPSVTSGVTWTSKNPNIATVNNSGLVTAIAPGDAIIEAKCEEDVLTCKISVKQKYILNSSTVDNFNYTLAASKEWDNNRTKDKIFDGKNSENDGWHGGSGKQWISITFKEKIIVKSFSITNKSSLNYDIKDFELQASNDGTNWTRIGSFSNPQTAGKKTAFPVSYNYTDDGFKAYRLYQESDFMSIGELELEFYSNQIQLEVNINKANVIIGNGEILQLISKTKPDPTKSVTWTSSDESVVTVSQSGLITAVGLGNATVQVSCEDKQATCQVEVKTKSVLNSTTKGNYTYTLAASKEWDSNRTKDKVFDGKNAENNGWHGGSGQQWLSITFNKKYIVPSFSITNKSSLNYDIKNFELQGSNDGTNWTKIGSFSNPQTAGKKTEFPVTYNYTNGGFKAYRLYQESDFMSIGELEFTLYE